MTLATEANQSELTLAGQ